MWIQKGDSEEVVRPIAPPLRFALGIVVLGIHALVALLLVVWLTSPGRLADVLFSYRIAPIEASVGLMLTVLIAGFIFRIKLTLIDFVWRDALKVAKKIKGRSRTAIKIRRFPLRVVKPLLEGRKMAARLSKPLLFIYAVLLVTIPLGPLATAEDMAQPGSSFMDTLTEESKFLSTFVMGDVSLNIMRVVFGSIIDDIRSDPLSFNVIRNGIDSANQSTGESEFTLNIFENKAFSNADSAVGLFTAASGYALIAMMLIASIYRIYFVLLHDGIQVATDSNHSNQLQQQMVKKMIVVGGSTGLAYSLSVPLIKGYSFLAILTFQCITASIAMTNQTVMYYFKEFHTTHSTVLQPQTQTDEIFGQLLAMTLCKSVAEKSESNGEKYNVEVQSTGNFIQVLASSCGDIKIAFKQNEMKSSAFAKVRGEDVVESERKIMEQIHKEYLNALVKLITNAAEVALILKESIDKAGKISSVPDLTDRCVDLATKKGPGLQITDLEAEQNRNSNMIRVEPDLFALMCGLRSDQSPMQKALDARQKFNTEIGAIITRAQQAFDRAGIGSKKPSSNTIGDVKLGDASTYGEFQKGWFMFPYFYSMQQWADRRLFDLLSITVSSSPYSITNEAVKADVDVANAFLVYWQQRLVQNEMLVDSENGLDKARALLESRDLSEDQFWAIDATVTHKLADLIVKPFRMDKNEHVITAFSSAGHYMINAFIGWNMISKGMFPIVGDLFSSVVKGGTKKDKIDQMKERVEDSLKTAEDNNDDFLSSMFSNVGGLWGKVGKFVVGSVVGLGEAYITMLKPLVNYLLPFAILCAYILPLLLFFMFAMAAVKWVIQVIKMVIFTSLSVLRIYSGEGGDLFSSEAKTVFMGILGVSILPLLIIAAMLSADQVVTPLAAFYQYLATLVLGVVFNDVMQGPLYAVVYIATLVLPPTYLIFYLYAFPSSIQDSALQYLSLNLGIANPSQGMGNMRTAMSFVPTPPVARPTSNPKTQNSAEATGSQASSNPSVMNPKSFIPGSVNFKGKF